MTGKLRALLASKGVHLPANPAHLPRGPEHRPWSDPNKERLAARVWLTTLFEPAPGRSLGAYQLKTECEADAGFYVSAEALADAALDLGWTVKPSRDREPHNVRVFCKRRAR